MDFIVWNDHSAIGPRGEGRALKVMRLGDRVTRGTVLGMVVNLTRAGMIQEKTSGHACEGRARLERVGKPSVNMDSTVTWAESQTGQGGGSESSSSLCSLPGGWEATTASCSCLHGFPSNEGLHPPTISQRNRFLPFNSLVKYVCHTNKKATTLQ